MPQQTRRRRRSRLTMWLAATGGLAVLGAGLHTATAAPPDGPAPAEAGAYPLHLVNNTHGTWRDDQVYATVIGQTKPGSWAYMKPDGSMAPIDHREESAPGHLTKNGRNFADMSFTLAQNAKPTMPTELQGGRVYLSLGAPMYLPVSPDDKGWGGPDPRSSTDPNKGTVFDWYELTYKHGEIPFGGNTTQVDQFGFPMTARLEQTSSHTDKKTGITASRAEVMRRYADQVGDAFQDLRSDQRILAPRSSESFGGGAQKDYLRASIDRTWEQYAKGFKLTRQGQTFEGEVSGGKLHFTKDGSGSFTLDKPTTQDVVQCSGALASKGMDKTELELGAEMCAAFNRGVAQSPAKWHDAESFYKSGPKNDYAGFFHSVSLGGKSYAFAYDDVDDQSSVAILPNSDAPTKLTLTVNW
ncbi:glycoside hydrolase family 64 protein [Streptomyces sp. ODS05-4]|uniref:glycoside hydrolase family 64 protein n=1 Tax=Streptomyces sp. ODS05-4 TaxID=2944939 RepID=UPI00210B4EF6|nr:glycoside hydrolase family 64 protein [Streptomyces sp. ODS05-4]